MASATRGESSNPYGGGLGTGGKFRKPTARRSQKTPYDRPPTSVRNSGLVGGEDRGGGGGWLSKLVDPAQRLITYSAHRLFASVFRKRLVSGETPLQSPEQHHRQQQLPERDVVQETKVGHSEDISALHMKNDFIRIEDTNASVKVDPSKDGFTDLEKLLKEKTFTRSEVDRLTALLRLKAADSSTVSVEQKNEMERAHPDNGNMNALVSTPVASSRAVDECIASPAQLAKAYMGSRPSEVTPSMLGLRGQAVREDSVFQNRTPFPSKSPATSLVPKPSGQRLRDNGFVTPRSRGRSAVYSMARTPYSRPQSTVKIGSLFQASPSRWVESLSSGSGQGLQSGLKRRSSVLDNDMGSVGPVRRIRQKSNLSSRSLALPSSESPLSVRYGGGQNIAQTSKDSAEDIPSSSLNLVPSKSSEMASKILQHLDNLVSTKEKSPSKLSPSMLRGQALKSLQNVEAPKLLNYLPEKKANLPGSSHQKQEKSRESGSRQVLTLSNNTGGTADDKSKTGCSKDKEACVEGTYLPLTSSLEEHPPKKRAFRMSADDEDLFELDDDHEVAGKQNAFKVENGVRNSMPIVEKPLTSSDAMPPSSYVTNGDTSQVASNGSLGVGRNKISDVRSEAIQQSNMASESPSTFIHGTKSSISPSKLISEEKEISREEPRKAAAVFPNIFSSPSATDLSHQNIDASADIKLEKNNSSAFGVSEVSAKQTESKNTVRNSSSGSESAAFTAIRSMFSGEANPVSQPSNNGSLGSVPSFQPISSNIPSNNPVSQVTATVQSVVATPTTSSVFGKFPSDTSNNSNSQSTSAPALSSTPPFKFGEPAAPFSASTVSASNGQMSKEAEEKTSPFGDINSFKFGGMASTDSKAGDVFAAKSSESKSTPSFVFGSSSPAVVDAGNNTVGGSSSSVVGGSTLNPSAVASSAPASSGGSIFGVTSSTPGVETSKFSWSSAAATGSNMFGTSTPASSGSSMFGGVAASATSAPSTASSVFGFNAVSSASAASSASAPSTASSVFGFGAGSSASAANAASAPSTASSVFGFNAVSSGSAANAASATSAPSTASSVFGFNAVSPASAASSQSQASNLFGASNAQTGNTGSGSTTSTQSVPFQFGSSASAPSFGSGNTPSNSFSFGVSKPEPPSPVPNSAPAFSSSFTASSSPTFSFGGSSAATSSNSFAPVFGAPTNTPSPSVFGFGSTPPATSQQPTFGNSAPSATPSQSPFGNSTPGFSFGASAPTSNTNGFNSNQQMSMEDSMAEDTDQANKASSMVQSPVFGQQPSAPMPQPGFSFGGAPATPPQPAANPFQFGGQPLQQNQFGGQPPQQNPSPFQASNSLEFQGGGSFSLGSAGGGDKSGRRIFKAKKTNRKR